MKPSAVGSHQSLVWAGVLELLANPSLVRAEIDRRLADLRASHPVDVKRDVATKELARLRAGITRLIEAYQEQLISLDELRTRMPSLRHREMAGSRRRPTPAALHRRRRAFGDALGRIANAIGRSMARDRLPRCRQSRRKRCSSH